MLVEVSARTEFYSGRLMDRPGVLEPTVKELRPAPSRKASANRMSPAGISMFYASADPQTAIAEIAGHGPEPYAMIGRFLNTRPLRLLDLTRAPAMPGYFDVQRHGELRMAIFRRSFVAAITRPVIPDGRQHIEYTPTQVITEYLRLVPETIIDGIALPSAQTDEKTYVLFFNGEDCAAAEELNLDGTRPLSPQLASIGSDEPPTFTLAHDDVQVWRVRRAYEGELFEPYGARRRSDVDT
ncbi:RES family NAD+ phosphorylase [Phytoactinopolyspora limicola]|uniref:RES family NAD+ phosphorylase n=1 Tax=Phytoactinopolyspora limicola TaxID=2715536 RepID=UPI00140B8161|nr:RES family NAD+ phosphorylase [Phytoactinopolyspora limicola]